jgi:diguanylate cyclase (GGDEF)-like protein
MVLKQLTVRSLMAIILFLVIGLWLSLRVYQQEAMEEVRASIDFLVRGAERDLEEIEDLEGAIQDYQTLWLRAVENPSPKLRRSLQVDRSRFEFVLKKVTGDELPSSLRKSVQKVTVVARLYFEETESVLQSGILMEGRKERIGRLEEEVLGEVGDLNDYYRQKLQPLVENGRRIVRRQRDKDLLFLGVSLAALTGVIAVIWFLVGVPLTELTRGVQLLAREKWENPLAVRGFGEIAALIRAFNAMAETIASQKRLLVEEAMTDELTGLLNFRAFQDRVQAELSRAERLGRPLSLILADIDFFKKFNDTRGHLAGNEALKEIARRIRKGSRLYDVVARYGGEEFAVVMPETDAARATSLAERVRKLVASDGFMLTISCGVASYPDEAQDLKELIAKADQKLYRAKAEGRNRVIF